MSLFAETLVEEWLNRQGYFTIRGIKDTIDEIDILGIKQREKDGWHGLHCEVQVSFRPVSYISKLTEKLQTELKVKKSTSAKHRSESQLEECVNAWVETKFTCNKKDTVRKNLYNGQWELYLIHGVVKESLELKMIESHGIKTIPFEKIIESLLEKSKLGLTSSAAGDLIEIMNFYHKSCPR